MNPSAAIAPSRKLFSFIALATFALTGKMAAAEFTMNFIPVDPTFGDNGLIDARCNRPGDGANVGCSGSWSNSGDATPFLQELINSGGVNYYHLIIGRPEDGFAQEIFMKTYGSYEGGPSSASLGDGICRYGGMMFSISQCNIVDPLAQTHDNIFTGNGSGDPRMVTIRQLMGGTWNSGTKTWSCEPGNELCYQFAKESYLLKPRVDITLQDTLEGMQAHFQVDMSNSDYATNTVAGAMINTLQFSDPFLSEANFDSAQDSMPGWEHITGGRYTFNGSGPTNSTTEPYSYVEGNFLLNQPWWMYKY